MGTVEAIVTNVRERPSTKKISDSVSSSDLDNLRAFKVAKVSLTGGAADSFPFTWQNPETNKIIIHEVIIRITTKGGTATAALNVSTATSATGTGTTIFGGLDLDAAANIYSSHNTTDSGTGNEKPHVADENGGTTPWVTGKCITEKCDNLVGAVYIFYTEV